MKTVEERVQEYLSKYVQTFNSQQERELIKLLKEQDRITRHHCAESANNAGDLSSPLIDRSIVHSVILNTKAV